MIDNCTGFESPDLETRTVAEGERKTGRGKGWGLVHMCVCRGGYLNQQLGTRGVGGERQWGLLGRANCKHMLAGRRWRDGLQWDSVREAVSSPSLQPCSPGIFRTLGRSVSQRKRGGGKDLSSRRLHRVPLSQICLGSQTPSCFAGVSVRRSSTDVNFKPDIADSFSYHASCEVQHPICLASFGSKKFGSWQFQ